MYEKHSSPSDDHLELLPVGDEAESTEEPHQRNLQLKTTHRSIREIVAVSRIHVDEARAEVERGM